MIEHQLSGMQMLNTHIADRATSFFICDLRDNEEKDIEDVADCHCCASSIWHGETAFFCVCPRPSAFYGERVNFGIEDIDYFGFLIS